ncbi:MAG: PAS domain S-box protein, partial [Pseudomonadota bacterium]
MMDLTPLFDILGTVGFGIAIRQAIRLPRAVIDPMPKGFLVAFLATYLVVMSMNTLEHTHITSWFDRFEDPLEIMFLPFFFFFIFSLKSTEEIRRRTRVEQEIQAQRQLLTRILETTPHGIAEIDAGGIITFANPGLHAIYGYAPGELPGQPVSRVSATEEKAAGLRRYLEDLVASQPEPTPWFSRDVRKDGQPVDVQVDWDYKRDEAGRVVGFVAAITDVTARQRMDEELSRSEKRFRQLVENAGDSFFIVNPRGGIIEVNQQAALSTGYSREELLAMHISKIDLEYPDEKRAEVVWQALQQEQRRTFRGLHRRKDGSTFPVEVRVALIDYLNGKAIFGIVRDITARVAAENTLRTQAQIISQTHDAVATTDFHGVVTSWNHGAEELLGYSAAEAIGRQIVTFCPPAHQKALRKSFVRPLLVKGSHELELDVSRKDGSTLHGHMSLSLLRNDQGRPFGVVVYLLDITARREAEQALRISEERLRLAITSGRQGLYDLDLVSGEAVANEEYGAILGYGPGEFVLNVPNWLESIHPDDRGRVERYFCDYVANGAGESKVEYRQRTKDGQWKWILSLGRIVAWDESGRPLRMLGTHTDLSEEKEAQAALARERQQLYDLLGGLPGFVCLLAEDYTIRFANRYFVEQFGEPGGKRCHEVLHHGADPCEGCGLSTVLDEDRSLTWEWSTAPNHLMYQIYDFPFRDVDGSRLMLKFGLDITERKAAEEDKLNLEKRLLYLQKLESLGVMAGGIAHDFNNVLMTIMGNTDLALLALPSDSPVREQLLATKSASRRAADLCKQMLSYTGEGSFVQVRIDLSRFVEEARHLLDVSVATKINFTLDLARDPPLIDAEPSQLRQLLVNMVT